MAKAQELMEQNPELSKAVAELEEQTLEEQVLAKLKEIEAILTKLDSDSIDLSVFLEQIQSFSDEKKAEIQALVDKLDNPLGKKTKTFSTLGDGFRVIDGQAYQEVWMKDGRITKYGGLYIRGYQIAGAMLGGSSTSSGDFLRQPFPDDVEFDMFWGDVTCIYARPKAGQSDVGNVVGSLDNYIWCYGKSNYGALGLGTTYDYYQTQKIAFNSRVRKMCVCSIAKGDAVTNTYVLLENNELWVAGRNSNSCFGLGNSTQINTWQKIQSDVLDIYAIWRSAFVVKSDGVYAMGYFEYNASGTSSLAVNTPTKVFSKIPLRIEFGKFYNGETVFMNSFIWSSYDNKLYGAGRNDGYQIVSTDKTTKQSFVKVSSNGDEFELADGDTFKSDGDTTYILKKNGANTEFFAGGNGYSGFGDSQAIGARALAKTHTFEGTGWELMMNQDGYIESDVYRSFFVVNKAKREIWAFGLNDGSGAGGLGVGTARSKERAFRQVLLPENVKNAKQFEVKPFYCGQSGGIAVIIDGDFYTCGSVITSCSLKFPCSIPQIQN